MSVKKTRESKSAMRCSVILQKYFGKLGNFLYVVQLIHRPTESPNKLYNIHKGASLHLFSFPLLAHGSILPFPLS